MMEKEIKGKNTWQLNGALNQPQPLWSFTRCESLIFHSSLKRLFSIPKAIVSIMLIFAEDHFISWFSDNILWWSVTPSLIFYVMFCYLPNFTTEMVEQEITRRTSNKNLQVCKRPTSLAWCRHLPPRSCQPLHWRAWISKALESKAWFEKKTVLTPPRHHSAWEEKGD